MQLRQLRAQLSQLGARVAQVKEQLRACHTVAGEDQDLIKETKRLEVEEEKFQAQVIRTIRFCSRFKVF